MAALGAGRGVEDVLAELDGFGRDDLPWRDGRTFAYVYAGGADVEAVGKRAYARFLTENALDPTVYPSLLRLENAVVGHACAHLRAPPGAVGTFTSGGTESCLLAVKAARDWARARGIAEPEVVLPVTAHAAFQKAANYFDVKAVLVPVDGDTWRVRAADVEAAMTPATALIVGSAPQYAHGVIDPIAELGELAGRRGVLLHVDACIGGFILPYFRRLGARVPDFDFAVPGVTSISMDYHKYAYCPKGASVLLWRDKDLRRHQIFTCATWTGYSVINTTMQSTKTGGPLAACWAVLNHLGDDGYLAFAERTLAATRAIADAVRAHPGLRLMAEPEASLVAFEADASVFGIVDAMRRRGWFVQPQLGFMGSRPNIHLSVGQASAALVDGFVADLGAAVEEARGANELLPGPVRELLGSLTAEAFTPELYGQLMAMASAGGAAGKGPASPSDGAGAAGGRLPEGTAGINAMLDAMRPEVAAKVMTEFFNDLFVAAR